MKLVKGNYFFNLFSAVAVYIGKTSNCSMIKLQINPFMFERKIVKYLILNCLNALHFTTLKHLPKY
jgi:hypothetical protein